jgi:hypothetical protein
MSISRRINYTNVLRTRTIIFIINYELRGDGNLATRRHEDIIILCTQQQLNVDGKMLLRKKNKKKMHFISVCDERVVVSHYFIF